MTPAAARYRALAAQLRAAAPEADTDGIREDMDDLWWKMTEAERLEVQEERPTTIARSEP